MEEDPRKEITVSEWHAAVTETVRYIRQRPGELRELLSRPEQKTVAQEFYFHALTDPKGDRFVFVSWVIPGSETEEDRRWMNAKGYFEGLSAKMNAYELRGGSADGVKVGTVTVDFVDCETAAFRYVPDDKSLKAQSRTARIDSGIWKYCQKTASTTGG